MSTVNQLDNKTSFEEVIEVTQSLLQQIETQSMPPDQIRADLIHLLNLDKGPRGFFASFLTAPGSLPDDPPDSMLSAFQSVPEVTAELLVKNLAMSTAMVIYHQRQENAEASAGSEQVQRRSQHLLKLLNLPVITEELNALQQSVAHSGSYSTFLERWNYDSDQRSAISAVVSSTLDLL